MLKKYNVVVFGGTGYVGQKLLQLILNHPYLTLVTSYLRVDQADKTSNLPVSMQHKVFHSLKGTIFLTLMELISSFSYAT